MGGFEAIQAKLDVLQAALDLEQEEVRRLTAAHRGVGAVTVPLPRLAFGDRLNMRPILSGTGRVS